MALLGVAAHIPDLLQPPQGPERQQLAGDVGSCRPRVPEVLLTGLLLEAVVRGEGKPGSNKLKYVCGERGLNGPFDLGAFSCCSVMVPLPSPA